MAVFQIQNLVVISAVVNACTCLINKARRNCHMDQVNVIKWRFSVFSKITKPLAVWESAIREYECPPHYEPGFLLYGRRCETKP